MLCFASGNRDEEVFADPFTFDIRRENSKQHVGFGYGAHQCLGKYLAEMEMKSFWKAVLPKIKSVQFNGDPERVQASFVSGPKKLPIQYELV